MRFEREKKVPADPRKLGFRDGCKVSSNGSKPKATRMKSEIKQTSKPTVEASICVGPEVT